MSGILPIIAVIVTVIAGWALLKRYQTHMTLLFAGLVILVCVALLGDANFLPKGAKTSGFWLFDIFVTLKTIATKQSSGIGFLIMTAGGFAAYMDRIGAARALVDIAVKPLAKLRAPYLVLAAGYIVGQVLVMVIPSAAGLAMLLLVALFPILKAVGTSPAAAAAVIGTSAGMTFTPTAGTANLAAKVAGLDPIIYLVQYQLPLAIPTLVVCCVAHYFVQRYYDRKNDDTYAEAAAVKAAETPEVPKWYALFPVLPIALLIIFSKLVVSSIKLDTIGALFMVWVLVVIIEIIRLRDVKKIFKDAQAMWQSMGKMFAGIVALIICAELFATGLQASGLIDLLIKSAQGIGAGMGFMTVVLTGIVSAVTFLTGSGVGAYSSFAAGLGGSVEALVTPMQFASGMLRAMSPVAGVIIAVAGAAGVTPMAIVRRTWIPMILGLVTTLVVNQILFG
ncbi:C4-dicarboxylate transporter DcuC [Sutterella sp.]|uniref:C4-dicarboxylate transporter DcuC n=1 Tax=Sutterella sp. TaxID=1981025 RepID=UPI0026E0F59F|nr:C4-dicarboxylate transporter DcuC [Sutterella sp.]MDO5532468.1 C4-dicarboxylate transporter DcuC [Sutterella sp.]